LFDAQRRRFTRRFFIADGCLRELLLMLPVSCRHNIMPLAAFFAMVLLQCQKMLMPPCHALPRQMLPRYVIDASHDAFSLFIAATFFAIALLILCLYYFRSRSAAIAVTAVDATAFSPAATLCAFTMAMLTLV